ncbi:25080_t:CDS:2 [Dentiscutata erythropus]|uniref:25080_t:CDS:1 n=1 Tax=Dentiscutata erythropus TaxID=1348616 RepID=A0A9N9I359_9GLOM|nr:25080_t:CDS:2 [Dentiscutata erythropus]
MASTSYLLSPSTITGGGGSTTLPGKHFCADLSSVLSVDFICCNSLALLSADGTEEWYGICKSKCG